MVKPENGGGFDAGDGISSINSEDIESMSVLKGGTAASLYGSRAAKMVQLSLLLKKGDSRKSQSRNTICLILKTLPS